MDKILYFPYINLPQSDWTVRTLIYYDKVGSIVPEEYFFNPEESYEPFMLELIREELVVPINPIDVLRNPWQVFDPFLEFIEKKKVSLKDRSKKFIAKIHKDKLDFNGTKLHADKFDNDI